MSITRTDQIIKPIPTPSAATMSAATMSAATPSAAMRPEPPIPPPPRAGHRRDEGHIDVELLPAPLTGSLTVRAWPDPHLAEHGHDLRSSYVDLFWTGILGPSSIVLLRRLASGLEHAPDGYLLPVVDTALSLGLGAPKSRQSRFVRALHRCVIFRVARFVGDDLEVRRRLPTLYQSQLRRLPDSLQATHRLIAHRPR